MLGAGLVRVHKDKLPAVRVAGAPSFDETSAVKFKGTAQVMKREMWTYPWVIPLLEPLRWLIMGVGKQFNNRNPDDDEINAVRKLLLLHGAKVTDFGPFMATLLHYQNTHVSLYAILDEYRRTNGADHWFFQEASRKRREVEISSQIATKET